MCRVSIHRGCIVFKHFFSLCWFCCPAAAVVLTLLILLHPRCFDKNHKLKQNQIWSLRIDPMLPITCNSTTAVREFGTAANCMQNFAISLAAS